MSNFPLFRLISTTIGISKDGVLGVSTPLAPEVIVGQQKTGCSFQNFEICTKKNCTIRNPHCLRLFQCNTAYYLDSSIIWISYPFTIYCNMVIWVVEFQKEGISKILGRTSTYSKEIIAFCQKWWGGQKCQNLTFKVYFLCQKLSESFQKKIHLIIWL